MTLRSRVALLSMVALACIGCDQVTKWIAKTHLTVGELHSYSGDTVRLQLAHNYGAFLGLGDSLSPTWRQGLWSIGVGTVLVVICVYALFAKSLERSLLLALALIFSGGVSNLYDRIVYDGYVIDFLNVGVGWLRTGIFNVADMGITTGALIVLWSAVRAGKQPS